MVSGSHTICTTIQTGLSFTAFGVTIDDRFFSSDSSEVQSLVSQLLSYNSITTASDYTCGFENVGVPFFLVSADVLTQTSTVTREAASQPATSDSAAPASSAVAPGPGPTSGGGQDPGTSNVAIVSQSLPGGASAAGPTQAPDGGKGGSSPGGVLASVIASPPPNYVPADSISPVVSEPVFSFGAEPYTLDPFSNFVVGSQTASPGGPAILAAGTPVSVASGATAIVIGSQTVPVRPQPAPAVVIAGITITPNAASAYVFGSHTAVPGGPPVTIPGGTVVSIAPGGTAAVVNGVTQGLSPVPSATVAGFAITPNAASAYAFGSQTAIPGGAPVTLPGGTVISIAPDGTAAVVNGVTQNLGPASAITIAGVAVVPNAASAYVFGDQTAFPGGPPITLPGGTVLSIARGGTAVVVNGATQSPGSALALATTAASELVLGTQTIVAGGPAITIAGGTVVSLATGGSAVVIDGQTEPLVATTAAGPNVGDVIFSVFGASGGYVAPKTGTLTDAGTVLTATGTAQGSIQFAAAPQRAECMLKTSIAALLIAILSTICGFSFL